MKPKVKCINVALTYIYYIKGTAEDIEKLCDICSEQVALDPTMTRALKSAEKFFDVNEKYVNQVIRYIGNPRVAMTLNYERRTKETEGKTVNVTRQLEPFLIISALPADIHEESEAGYILLLTFLFDTKELDLEIDEATDLTISLIQQIYGTKMTLLDPKDAADVGKDVPILKYLEKEMEARKEKYEYLEYSYATALAIEGYSETFDNDYAQQIYGALFGDEGWRDAPKDYTIRKLDRVGWSSREYFKVYFSPTSTLLVGDYRDRVEHEALFFRREEWRKYIELSHSTKVPPLFWHGIFLTYEWSVFARKIYQQIHKTLQKMEEEARQIAFGEKKTSVSEMEEKIKEIENYASRLATVKDVLDAEKMRIAEITYMMRILNQEFGVTELSQLLENSIQRLTAIHDKLYQRITMKNSNLQRLYFQILSALIAIISLVALTPLIAPLTLTGLDIDTARAFITLTALTILTSVYIIKSKRG